MGTWDYRVFREDAGTFIIREVYYEDDGTIMACTTDAAEPMGETLEELAQDIEWFKAALKLPVLTMADIPPDVLENEHAQNQKIEGNL